MMRDTITDSIRAVRRALAAKFDNDIQRIGADLRRQQNGSNRTFVRLPRRQPRIGPTTNGAMHVNAGAGKRKR